MQRQIVFREVVGVLHVVELDRALRKGVQLKMQRL